MKTLYLFILMLVAKSIIAQPSDFFTLKKRGKTVKTFFAGSHISFVTNRGANFFNVHISNVRNDSIFVKEYLIIQVPTSYGAYVLDTAATYRYGFHYKDLATVYHDKKGFSFSGSGASLMGGGLLIMAISGVLYLVDRSQFSLQLVGVSAGLGLVGYLLSRMQNKNFKIGKKYQLNYMSVSSK
jgi:hypothetical protein